MSQIYQLGIDNGSFPMILNASTVFAKSSHSENIKNCPILLLLDANTDLSNEDDSTIPIVESFIESIEEELFVVYHITGTNWQNKHHAPIIEFCKKLHKGLHWVSAHHGEDTIYGDLKKYIEACTNEEKEKILIKMQESIFSERKESIIESYYSAIRRKGISEGEIQRIKEEIKKANLLLR